GHERLIDLPQIDFCGSDKTVTRLFTQMAGFGWDARACQLVDWHLKKRIGRFAYFVAGLQAMRERLPEITVNDGARSLRGEFIIVGNGRFYGGAWALCSHAAWDDGLLEGTVFKGGTVGTVLRVAWAIRV